MGHYGLSTMSMVEQRSREIEEEEEEEEEEHFEGEQRSGENGEERTLSSDMSGRTMREDFASGSR